MWVDIELDPKFYQRNAAQAFADLLNKKRIVASSVIILHDDKGRIVSAVGWQVPVDQWRIAE